MRPIKRLEKKIKHQQGHIIDICLSSIDQVGRTLKACGVNNNINRHQLIGMAFVQKNRLIGEKSRLELKLQKSLKPVRSVRGKIDHHIDHAIDHLPSKLAQKAHITHDKLREITKF